MSTRQQFPEGVWVLLFVLGLGLVIEFLFWTGVHWFGIIR